MFRTILCIIVGALGLLIIGMSWYGLMSGAGDEKALMVFLCLFITACVGGIAVPLIILFSSGEFGTALMFFLKGSLPAAIATFVLFIDAGLFKGMFTGDVKGLELFVAIVMYASIAVLLTSLAVALIMLLEFVPYACVWILWRISLPAFFIGAGISLWAYLFVYHLQEYTMFARVIHSIGISFAILGVVAALITLTEGFPLVAGFCTGLAAAIVFVVYLVFGIALLFTRVYWLWAVLGIMGFYLVLGGLYVACRFRKIREIVDDAVLRCWN